MHYFLAMTPIIMLRKLHTLQKLHSFTKYYSHILQDMIMILVQLGA